MKLEIQKLSVTLDKRDILREVSLQVEEGEFLSLLGPSGCRKTTLLKTIAGIYTPRSGSIRLGGEELTGLPPHKRGVVILFQDIRLFPHMTVEGNVAFPLKVRGVRRGERLERARSLLERVRLPDYGDRRVGTLSGGERQRVALARSLAAKPRLLLLDEPFSALDENLRDDMRELVLSLHREFHMTTVLVTHDRSEALSMSDRVALLFDGHVEQHGTPEQVYRCPATRRAADYFGGCSYLDGRVERGVFSCGLFTVPSALPEGEYTLCLRQQAWRRSETGACSLTVEQVRFRGAETLLLLEAEDGTRFPMLISDAAPTRRGDVLRFDLDESALVFFPREAAP